MIFQVHATLHVQATRIAEDRPRSKRPRTELHPAVEEADDQPIRQRARNVPHDLSLLGLSDPRKYQERFQELAAATGCKLFDPLPELLKLPASERAKLWSDAYGHFSAAGHQEVARLLKPVLQEIMVATRKPA